MWKTKCTTIFSLILFPTIFNFSLPFSFPPPHSTKSKGGNSQEGGGGEGDFACIYTNGQVCTCDLTRLPVAFIPNRNVACPARELTAMFN